MPSGWVVAWGASFFMMASGLVYAAAFMWTGGDWTGPTSLRKPILFGLSTGVTLASLAWVATALAPRPRDRWVPWVLTVSLLLEVGLIDLQQARGVPSHFNRSSFWDGIITDAMGVLILVATALVVDLTVRSFRQLHRGPDDRWAARAGLVFLGLGCFLGIGITAIGEVQQAQGMAPETYGESGVLKFAHGLPLHGIQILAVQAWVLRRLNVALDARVRSIQASIVGLGAVTVYGVVQTAAGAPRWPPEGASWGFAILTGLGFAVAATLGLRGRRPKPA